MPVIRWDLGYHIRVRRCQELYPELFIYENISIFNEIKIQFEDKGRGRYYGYNVYISDQVPVNNDRTVPYTFIKIVAKEDNKTATTETTPIIEQITDKKARYVLVEVTSCSEYETVNKWEVASIYELQVYGTEITSGENPEEPDNPDTPDTPDTPEQLDIPIQTASGRDDTYVKEIDGDWQFGGENLGETDALNADYTQWSKVTIPHTWNNKDGEDGGGNYKRTKYWYHKEITIDEDISNKDVYLEFFGSNQQTTLYVNEKKAGDTHKGGYTAFRYNIGGLLQKGSNKLDVCVDNTWNEAIAPISGGFNMYGGIYRRVYLVAVDKVHVDLEKYGSSGLLLETGNMRSKEAPKDLGKFNIKADLANHSDQAKKVTVTATVTGDNAPEAITKEITIPANGSMEFNEPCTVSNPTLWEGIRYEKGADNSKAGYRYTVTLEIKEGDTVIDKVEDKIGFRYFWIDSQDNGESGEGFFLNGKKYPLRGVNRHSYLATAGSAMTEAQHKKDMDIIKELGVNTICLCHYPQTDYFYDLCDEKGIIVWTEIPVVNEVRAADEFKNITKQQLTELINQQYNRPSVCFWGLESTGLCLILR